MKQEHEKPLSQLSITAQGIFIYKKIKMRTNNGAIQLSRSIYDSEIWTKPSDWLKIWVYILGRVNFKDNNLYKRGENLFNYQIIAIECGVKYKSVENCIKFLKDREQVETQKTTRGVHLKVINYNKYQDIGNYEGNRQEIDREQTGNRQGTITEEGKNVRKKEIYIGANRSEVLQELDNIIYYWNDNFRESRKVTPKLQDVYLGVRKKYPKVDISSALGKYTKEKLDGDPKYWLDPLRFLKQDNGFIKYL